MSPLRRLVAFGLALATAAATLVAGAGGASASGSAAVTLTSSAASVAPGSTVDLTASAPIAQAGSTTQEITQIIDPAKVRLTNVSDITYPSGWTLSYCSGAATDCTLPGNFSATTPANAAAWANVKAVKATGAVDSQGASGGYQIAAGTASGTGVRQTPATIAASGTGDGYQAFFDPGYTRVFNVFHHNTTTAQVDCHVIRTGATCAGFPFRAGVARTGQYSTGRVVGTKIWIPGYQQGATTAQDSVGFACVDIAAVLSSGGAPSLCATSFVPLATGATVNSRGTARSSQPGLFEIRSIDGVSTAGSAAESKLWSMVVGTGNLICLDTATGAACAGMPANGWPTAVKGWKLDSTSDGGYFTSLVIADGRIYLEGSDSANPSTVGNLTVACVLVSNPATECTGFTGGKNLGRANTRMNPGASTAMYGASRVGNLVALPAADGTLRGACLMGDTRALDYFDIESVRSASSTTAVPCWDANGTAFNGPATLSTMVTSAFSYGFVEYQQPLSTGSRIFWGNGVNFSGDANYPPRTFCWDASVASGAGGPCAGMLATGYATDNYTASPDPVISNCMWVTRDTQPNLRTYNMVDRVASCASVAPSTVSFSGSSIVPRMACTANPDAIRAWQSFTLMSVAGSSDYAATLTIKDSSGVNIPGWVDLVVSAGTPIDLSSLLPATTGLTPSFDVTINPRSGSPTTASAKVVVVGDAPELCTRVTAQAVCPVALGPVDPGALAPGTAAFTATGSSTASGVSTGFAPGTASLTITTASVAQCGSTLTGRGGTATLGTTGLPIPGMTVSLLNGSGSAVTYPSDFSTAALRGQPVTATTDDSGNYSFGFLTPGSYKVSFPSTTAYTSTSATVAAGATGSSLTTVNAVSGTSISAVDVLAVGTNGVVNGLYVVNPIARPNTSTGGQGAVQTISPLADDSASTGATYSGGSTAVRLCDAGGVNCNTSSRLVPGQGQYAISGTNVTFTPCTAAGSPYASCTGAFTGTATAVAYQSVDSLGRTATSTITPTVVAAPVASNDTSTGSFATTQVIAVRANDTAGTGTSLVASSIELCAAGTADATCDSSNLKRLVIAGQGVYVVDDTTGQVNFIPCSANGVPSNTTYTGLNCTSGFTGVATSVKYIVKDGLGQIGSATISPTVTAPPAVVAGADTSAGLIGVAQSVNPLTNDDTVTSTVSKDATSVRLCSTGQSPPNCTATSLVVSGQGSYSVNGTTGVITFTPCSGVNTPVMSPACTGAFTGAGTAVTYQAKDNLNRTFSSTYTPTVYGTPTASADTSSGAFNTAQTITPLGNDTAGVATTLTASSVRLCAVSPVKIPPNCDDTTATVSGQGTYSVNASGVVTFTPLSTFYGTATALKYQVSDSAGQVANSTITPTVSAPAVDVANADTSTGGQGVTQSVNPLANDTAPTGVSLVASTVRLCTVSQTPPGCTGTTLTNAQGTYTVNPGTGVISFAPCTAAGVPNGSCTGAFTGTATPVTYQVSDNLSTPRTVSSTYTPTVVATPNAVDDTSTGPYGQAQTISVLGNDAAGAGTSLVASSVRLCGPGDPVGACDDTTVTVSGQGTYTVNANGTVSFAPAPGFSGTAAAVSYEVADGLGQKDAATITVTVTPPVPPSAGDDTVVVRPGASAPFASITGAGGLATSGDGSLVASNTRLCGPGDDSTVSGVGGCDDTTVTISGVGTWQLVPATGVVTFTAAPGALPGATGSVDYRVLDTNGQSAVGRLTAVIPPPPTARDDTSYGEQGQVQVLLPTGNDTSGDPGASMSPASVRLCGAGDDSTVPGSCDDTTVTVSGQGTYTVNPVTGAVSFTPVDDTFYGAVTPVAYQVADTTGQVGTAQLRPVVLPRPAPRATDDTGYAPYGQSVTLTALANDDSGTIPPDDTTISGLTLDAASLRLCAAGESPPTCSATSVTTVDGTYTLAGSTVTFAPASGFSGTVTAPVQYQVSNAYSQTGVSKAQTGSAYLVPSIGAPTPPVALDDSAIGLVNTSVSLSPLANDSAGQRFALVPGSLRLCGADDTAPNCAATTVNVAGKGTFTLNPATGAVTFTPLPDWTGAASVPYVVADAGGQVVDADITVIVKAPAAADDTSYGRPGTAQSISVLGNDAPAAGTGTSLVASSVRLCGVGQSGAACDQTSVTTAKGTYAVNTGTGVVTFTPAPGFTSGDDSVGYVVADSAGQLASAVIRPSVVSPPVPVAADDSAYGPLGGSVTFQPWTNDTAMGNRTQGTVSYDDSGFTHASVRLCGPGDAAGSCDDTTVTTADGTYVVNTGTGVVTFTPVTGFTGTAAFPVGYEIANPYTWTDSSGSGSATQVAAATLTPVIVTPPTPSAVDDTGYAGFGQPVSFSPWTNDSAMGNRTQGTVTYTGSALTPASVRLCGAGDVVPTCDDTMVTTADGTYTVNVGTGVVTFTPAPGFTGPATPVRYQIDNPYSATNSGTSAGGGTQTTSALLTPTIGPLTPPNADSDAGSGYVDDTVTVNLVANDDSGTYALVPSSVRLCDDTDVAPNCTRTSLVLAGQGTLTVNSAGVVVFTPVPGWSGQVSAPYSIADTSGNRDTSTVTITIIPPAPPTATDDTATTAAGTPVILDTGTDDDTGTYPLAMSSVRLCGVGDVAPACDDTTVAGIQGTFVVNPNGTVTFTPAAGWSGTVTIPYSIADARGNRDDALLTVIVTAPAPPPGGGGGGGGGTPTPTPTPTPSPSPGPDPVTEPDQGLGRPGEPVRIDPIGNDSPGQGQAFDEGSLRLCPAGSTPPACTSLVVPSPQGTWVVDPFTGGVVFTPAEGFKGKVEIPYVIETDDGDEVDSVITVWITGPPAATDDASTGRVDTPQTLTPLGNDAADAAPWVPGTLRLCAAGQVPAGCDATEVTTPDGVYRVDPASGKVIFTPAPGFTGDATPIQYQVADEAGQVAHAWLRPRVAGGQSAESGWLHVRKVITKGADLRTGQVKLVTVCTGEAGQSVKRTHVMDTDVDRDTWRVRVPAGMTCKVHERAHGAPTTPGMAPMWDERRWQVGHTPSIDVGEKVTVGTATAIDRLILSAKGGCAIVAGELVGVAVGTCIVTWRAPGASVTSTTRWTHTTARATRTGEGTLTRAIPIAGGATTRVTFTNAYDARAYVVTRTVYITDPCAPTPKIGPRYAGNDPVPNPGTCT